MHDKTLCEVLESCLWVAVGMCVEIGAQIREALDDLLKRRDHEESPEEDD